MRRSWAEQKDETWKANALHAHTHFCLTFESTSQVNSEAGVYGDAVVFMRLQQWQLWTEAACFHLSVWTSSPGNLFKSAPNIRLDSVMYLQNISWSLLRTRRNRYSDYISHLVRCWSAETNRRCRLSNCAPRRDLWVKWTRTSRLWWSMDEDEQRFDPEIKRKRTVRPANNNYLNYWWCL